MREIDGQRTHVIGIQRGRHADHDRVVTGQLLAELDATALQAAADRARADVNLSIPQVELAESTLRRREKLAAKGLARNNFV